MIITDVPTPNRNNRPTIKMLKIFIRKLPFSKNKFCLHFSKVK